MGRPLQASALSRLLLVLTVLLCISILTPTRPVRAAGFVVNTTSDTDDGTCDTTHCSLREALNAADADFGADTISFAIGSGPATINLTSGFSDILWPVTIDGTTQPGYAGAPLIELNGSGAGGATALTFYEGASNSVVRGLIINRFGGHGIYMDGPDNVTIAGNYIGTNAAGTAAAPNGGSGIYMYSGATEGILIGGLTASDRNIISGNAGHGIYKYAATTTIWGNYIGTDVTGTQPIGNGGHGIDFIDMSSGTSIGGTAAGMGNIIRYNTLNGVNIYRSYSAVLMVGNQISSNGGMGIDRTDDTAIDGDGVTPNDEDDADIIQNFPIITTAFTVAGTVTINGTVNSTPGITLGIELYSQSTCDASGNGEGDYYLGRTSAAINGSGDGTFSFIGNIPADGAVITATATNSHPATSEFSACVDAIGTATFVVNSTNDLDDGTCNTAHCSLREAITAANAHSGADGINFAIGAGAQTISLTSALPTITETVLINGTTQPGFTSAPLIELNGTNAGANTHGLAFGSGTNSSAVRGLVINRFSKNGILIQGGNGITITGSYIGTDATGTIDLGNGTNGVEIDSSLSSVVGGSTPIDRNIISGNGGAGVAIVSSTAVNVYGSYIGTDIAGTSALPNDGGGVTVGNSTSIGVGGTGAGLGNLIRSNTGAGVGVSLNSQSVIIRGNQITSNSGQGIDLNQDGLTAINDTFDGDTGANSLQNYPVITSAVNNAGTTTVAGTLNSNSNSTFSIDLYAQSTCDASGYGEGQTFLGSTSVNTLGLGDGAFSLNVGSVAVGQVITAIATNASTFNTSEFSACYTVTLPPFVVNTTDDNDDGVCDTTHCSLREAIDAADSRAGTDTIEFAIGTGPQTIMQGALHINVFGPVIIDGTSQPGYAGVPLIELNGTNAGSSHGLRFRSGSGGSRVSGLIFNHYANTPLFISDASNITITGNYIGTNAAGTAALPNGTGIIIDGPSTGNIIGGSNAADRNIISGNTTDGIYMSQDTSATIRGNYIGTDVTGIFALGNGSDGIHLNGPSDVTIGGTSAGQGNRIRHNTANGITITHGSAADNQIIGNQISSNGALGIDIGNDGVTSNDTLDADTGPNGLQNYPVITSAVNASDNVTVTGTLHSQANTTYTIHFYGQTDCDASGNGEGEGYLTSTSVTTNGSGDATFSRLVGDLAVGSDITATATDPANATSEFSACYAVTPPQTATVALTPDSNDIVEGGTYIPVVVLTTSDGQDLINAITVDVVNLGTGTAAAGDHNFATTTITFNAGSNSGFGQGFGLETVDDTLDENDETLIVGLSNVTGANASIGTPDTFTLTITDDDTQTTSVQFSSSGYTTTDETGTTYNVEVALTTSDGNPLVNAITVDVSDLLTGSAASGSDYSFSTTGLTFTAGSANGSTQNATIGVTSDILDEADETVNLALGNLTGTNASLGSQTSYTLTITDDDTQTATIQFTSSGATTTDETGTTYTAEVSVVTSDGQSLINAIDTAVYELGTGTASAADYSFTNTYLTFPTGAASGSTQTATVGVIADILDENNETVDLGVNILNGTNASFGSQTTYTLTITDDDTQTATVQFTSSGSSTPDETGTTYNIDVSVTTSDGQVLIQPITVDMSDPGTGSAVSGSDYSFSTTTLTFTAGATSGSTQSATIGVTADFLIEGNETVDLGLGNLTGTNASLGSQTGYIFTITDDDTQTNVAFSSSGFSTPDESGTTYNVEVVLTTDNSTALTSPVTIDVSDLGTGSAGSGSDYTSFSATTLTFPAGSASGSTQTVTLTVIADSLDEANETVDLGLSNVTGTNAIIGTQASYTLTITDDDGIGVVIRPRRLRIQAGESRTFTVVLTAQPSSDVTITVGQPERCIVRPRTLTFTPANWNVRQTVTVRARNIPDTRCVIRHTATGGGYDGVNIRRVIVTIP